MASNLITVSMALLAIGILLFTWGIGSEEIIARNTGILVVVISIIMWYGGIQLAKRELDEKRRERDKERQERDKQVKAILESIERNTEAIKNNKANKDK